MAEITVLSAAGEYALPDELRRSCAFTLEDGALREYVTASFKSDAANRYTHIKMALTRKHGAPAKSTIDDAGIRRIYDHHEKAAAKKEESKGLIEVDNLPLEQSLRIFLDVIKRAVEEGAVDVHWVVREHSTTILFRIHGRIEHSDEFTFSRDLATGLLGAIYGTSKDVTDRSFSPRNRSACTLRFFDPPVSIRWQTIPTGDAQGIEYDVVLRVTKQDISSQEKVATLDVLGYLPDQVELLGASCNSPGGIFMSGITGSGKTTALRSLMRMARGDGDKKIYTVEDPIELKIFGATQVSARGHNIAEIMHSFLRGDPDIVMVGEIRSREVAGVMQTVLRSGHKMMTTIHASSALAIVSRLASDEVGVHRETLVEPGFVSALVYQHLMPTLCPSCKLPVSEHMNRVERIARYLFDDHWYGLNPNGMFVRNHDGCDKCRRGISGMTICAEVVRPTYEMNKLLRDRKDAEALHEYRALRRSSFDNHSTLGKTAYEIAIYKASQGLIDPNDINDMCGAMSLQEIYKGLYEN